MNIINTITDYIQSPNSTGAILLNGPWGVGKSHYWRNKIVTVLEEIINKNTGHKYKCIYISLNGIKSTGDIDKQLGLAKLGLSNPKLSKKTKVINSLMISIGSRITGLSKYFGSNSSNDFDRINISDFLNLENNIICFDDLERNNIQEEILGFINTFFVETAHIKTIIIGSETDMKESEGYHKIKEKVIFRTILFPDNLTGLQELFQSYSDDTSFYNFLLKQQSYLHDLIKEYKIKNLRSIVFGLDILHKIFTSCQLDDKRAELKQSLVLFVFIIVNEFKTGNLLSTDCGDYKDLQNLSDPAYFQLMMTNRLVKQNREMRGDNTEEPTYEMIIYEQYVLEKRREFFFFSEVYDYILSGDFNEQLIVADLAKFESFVKTRDIRDTPQQKAHEILYNAYWATDDSAIETAKTNFLNYLKDGDYLFYEYGKFFDLMMELINSKIIDGNKEDVRNIVLEGLRKAISNYEGPVNPLEERQVRRMQSKDAKINILINEKLSSLEVAKEIEELTDFFKVLNGELKDLANHYERFNPFEYINGKELFDRLETLSITAYRSFSDHIDEIAKNDPINHEYKKYESDIEELRNKLVSNETRLPTGLKKYHTNNITRTLNVMLDKLSRGG